MKKKKLLLGLFLLPFLFSCKTGNESDSVSLEVEPGITSEINPVIVSAAKFSENYDSSNSKFVVLFYVKGTSDYSDRTCYMWKDEGKTSSVSMSNIKSDSYNFGYMDLYDGTTLAAGLPDDVKPFFDNQEDAKLIVKNTGTNWSWQTPDLVLPLSSGKKHYLVISEKDTKSAAEVYTLSDNLTPSMTSVSAEDATSLKAVLSVKFGLEGKADSNGFIITDSDGNQVSISDVKNYEFKNTNDRYNNFADIIYIELAQNLDFSKKYYIKHEKFEPKNGFLINTANALKISLKDFIYTQGDLGLTLNENKATFKTWAPIAKNVTLLLFKNAQQLETPDSTETMTMNPDSGIWSVSNVDITDYNYYKFRINNNGVENDVCDIYAKAASADSVAAQIVNINSDTRAIPSESVSYGTKETYKNPFGNNDSETKKYTDAVIYEMHIRDWSRLEVADSTGKFLDIADGSKVIKHIKQLGVTHVQILPMFDYAQKNTDEDYNWGYNPYHYNVPEGRYVKDMKDGSDAVVQMRKMINAFHEAGIAVNMDVVYNHTSGTGKGSLYDMTIPYYYYRLNEDGTYSNGSGCGNETDSSAPMFRQYMIESLKHWMLDYHINGFRFDLMGLHETETMKAIYTALSEIDKNVMVYGEPWTGGASPVKNGAGKAIINECADNTYSTNGVACFNDDFRNAIKGSEYPAFSKGEVSGYSKGTSDTVIKGLLHKNFNAVLGRSINYVECHDNLTLADKLALVMNGKTSASEGNWVGTSANQSAIIQTGKLSTLKKQDELAASMMFLAPGTAFINGGQEFMRSKDGDENSYISSDEINEIRQEYIDDYTDVTNYYKGLISLRKQYPECFGGNTSPKAERLVEGLIKYTAGDFVVLFNSSANDLNISNYQIIGNIVDISTGEIIISETSELQKTVSGISTLIIKTK